jgi:hypothetical protein
VRDCRNMKKTVPAFSPQSLNPFPQVVTLFKNFPPGAFFHSIKKFSTFYTVPKVLSRQALVEDYIEKIRETLENAVVK